MYSLCEKTITVEGQKYQSYGIAFEDEIIADITTDKKRMEELIKMVNGLDVSPVHIRDIVEDFIQ